MQINDVQLRLVDADGDGIFEYADLDSEALPIGITYTSESQTWNSFASTDAIEQTVSIPATSTNNRLLNYFHLPSAEAIAGREYLFDLSVRGLVLISGRAVIDSVETIGGRNERMPNRYNLQLLGNNFDWAAQLRGGLRLKDLDFTDLTTSITASNVSAGITAQYPAQKSGFCLIKYAAWKNNNTGTGGIGANVPDLSEFTPFLFARHVLQKVFDKIGKRLVSVFFDSTEFGRYILPLPMPNTYGSDFAAEYTKIKATSNIFTPTNTFINYNTQTYTPAIGANPLSGATYTVGFRGFIKIQSKTTHQRNTIMSPTIRGLEIWVNGVMRFRYFPPLVGAVISEANYTSPVFEVNVGDTIQLKNPQYWLFVTPPNSDIIAAELTIELDARVRYGEYNIPVIYRYLLGSGTVRDFLLGLTQLFSLIWTSDNLGNVYCEPANPYTAIDAPTNTSVPDSGFYGSPDLGFLREKEDMLQGGSVTNQAADFNVFTFAMLEDQNEAYTKQREEEQGLPFGAVRVEGSNSGSPKEEERTNAFFATCFHTFDLDMSATDATGSKNICQVPLLYAVPNSNSPRTFKPRLLCFYASGIHPFGRMRYTANYTTPIQEIDYPFAFAVNYRDDTGLSPVLVYSDVEINQRMRSGLFARFFAKNVKISTNSKLINTYFALSLLEIQTFDFRRLYFYQNSQCRVLKIENYEPLLNRSTRFVLEPIKPTRPEFSQTDSPTTGLV